MPSRSKAALLFPERIRMRLVQQVPPGTPGAFVDAVFGKSWSTSASKGLNGAGGFQQVEVDPVMNDSSEMTMQLPPQGGDGIDNPDRFYYYADTPDPSGDGSTNGYMPGDEWVELSRGQNELVMSATPVSETTTQQQLNVVARDVTEFFRKSKETASGFWNHAPRDVFEHYTRSWQAIVANDFNAASELSLYGKSGGLTVDGNSNAVLSITGSSAYLYPNASSWALSDAGQSDHSCWRAEFSIAAASFLSANPLICLGVADAKTTIPALPTNGGLGVYSLQLAPAAGTVFAVTEDPSGLLWRSWPTNATALLDAANQFAPPYTIAIEARERWVYFYLNGQLISVVPRVNFPTSSHDVRPYVYVSGSVNDSVSVDYMILRRTTVPLNGGMSGDYFLPSTPDNGGLQGAYYDMTLASVGTPDTGISSGQYGAAAPTVTPSAVRVDNGLLYASAANKLAVPSAVSVTSARCTNGHQESALYFEITAGNSNGQTTPSAEVSVGSPGSLGVPQNFSVSAGSGGSGGYQFFYYCVTAIGTPDGGSGQCETTASALAGTFASPGSVSTLSWSPVPGAFGYQFYESSSQSGPFYFVNGTTATSVTIYNEQAGAAATPPATDTSYRYEAIVSWAAVSGAVGYDIYRGTSSGAEKYLAATASTSYTDNNTVSTSSSSPPTTNTATSPSTNAPAWFPDALGNAASAYARWTGSVYLPLGAGAPVVVKLGASNVSQAMWVGKTRQGESILAATASVPAYPPTVLDDNPFCYFRMSETSGSSLVDAAGSVSDAIYNATVNATNSPVVTHVITLTGDSTTAVEFNQGGSLGATASGFALCQSSQDAAFNVGTAEAWIWPGTTSGSSPGGIVVKNGAYGMFLYNGTLQVYDWSRSTWVDSGVTISTSSQQHVVFSFNSGVTNGSHIYVNGVLKATFTYTASSQALALAIGAGNAQTGIQTFVGYIGEVAVYPYQLSASQIANHFREGSNKFLTDYSSETIRATSVDLRTVLGTTSGWYPMVFEYIYHQQDTGLTTAVGFTDASGNVYAPRSLSPYGCFTQQVTPQDSHFDTLQSTIGESFAYQWKSQPMALESGWFPGAVVPRARVGRDTDYIMDGSVVANPQETSTAEDNALTDLASAQGLGGNNSGSLTAEAFNFDELLAHPFVLTESESLPATTELSLLTLQLATLLEFRSEAWQQLTADASAPRSMQDSWPLSRSLAEFDWQPGDGLRVQIPEIFVNDIDPRQVWSLKRIFYQDGIGQTSVSFRQRQRNFEFALRRFIRQFTSDRRQFQGQLVERTGSPASAPAFTSVPLPADLTTVRQATLTILSKSDNTTQFAVEVNGQDTGQMVNTPGVLDISNAIGRNNAVQPQMLVRLTTTSTSPATVTYVVSLLILVQAV